MRTRTKAGKLLKVAYATYRRGEEELARDIFCLAMEEPDANEAVEAPAPEGKDEDSLKSDLMQAMEENDIDKARSALDQLEELKTGGGELGGGGDGGGGDGGGDAETPVCTCTGDEVDPTCPEHGHHEEEVPNELPPATVGMMVALAKRITAAGHRDLGRKITRALGL